MTHALKPIVAAAALAALLPARTLAQQQPQPGYGAPAYAQEWKPGLQLTGLAGYHISSEIGLATGHVGIDSAASYGAELGFRVRPGYTATLMWVIVPTNAEVVSTLGSGKGSLTINYFQIGGEKSFRKEKLEPYFLATIGASVFSFDSLTLSTGTRIQGSDVWRFAFTVGAGLRFWLNEKLALQADARMLAPVWFSGGSVYVGTGGAGLGVSGGIPTVGGNFTGGLVFAP